MNNKLKKPIGFLALFGYCFITALSLLTIHYAVSNQANPFVVAFYTILLTLLFFNIINFNKIKSTYIKAFEQKKQIFFINLITLIMWLPVFVGLKYISPTAFLSISLGSLPLITAWTEFRKESFHKIIIAVGIAILLAIITIALNSQSSHGLQMIVGGCLAFICGGSIVLYAKLSKRVESLLEFSPMQILSIRFYLLVIASFLIGLTEPSMAVFYQNIYMSHILIIALASNILPVLFFQNSISLLGPQITVNLLPLTILMVYFLEIILGKPLSMIVLFSLILLIILLFLFNKPSTSK